MIKKYIIPVIAILALILAIGSWVSGKTNSSVVSLKGVSNLDTLSVTGLKVGSGCADAFGSCTANTITQLSTGICYIDPYASTIAATSTVSVDCQGTLAADANGSSALSGIVNGDAVVATLSTTTAGSTVAGLRIIGASASTTAGHIELKIANQTGTTFTWPTTLGVASGTASYISAR